MLTFPRSLLYLAIVTLVLYSTCLMSSRQLDFRLSHSCDVWVEIIQRLSQSFPLELTHGSTTTVYYCDTAERGAKLLRANRIPA